MKHTDKDNRIRCPVSRLLSDCTHLLRQNHARHLESAVFPLTTALRKIEQGRAQPQDFHLISTLSRRLESSCNAPLASFARSMVRIIDTQQDVIETHIKTRVCPTGDCKDLSLAPCQEACPAGIDVAGYIALIGQGRDLEAIQLIRKANPFPWVCGLACHHPCEAACVRGSMDDPLAIRDLKAFAAKAVLDGAEAKFQNPVKKPDNGHKVCIVGSGPSGLTAAYFLSLGGYRAMVVEALSNAGGMMRVGLPRFRLPANVLDREIDLIQELGVEFRFNTQLGIDTSFENLRQEGYKAFYIAIGCHVSLDMGIKGETAFTQSMDALTYLKRVSQGRVPDIGPRVTVIGGGNVALDAARTALRQGCAEVKILYRRTRKEMPASAEEFEKAQKEGVQFSFLKIPVEILGKNDSLYGIRCLDARMEQAGENGRERPIPIIKSEHELRTDAVIHAVGHYPQSKGIKELNHVVWSSRGTIVADAFSGQTGDESVFAGGDVVRGPATIIEAIADGKNAAAHMDAYFKGAPLQIGDRSVSLRTHTPFIQVSAAMKSYLKRPSPAMLAKDSRIGTFAPVYLGLEPDDARSESMRCLRCDVCIRCQQCVQACTDKLGFSALKLGYLDQEKNGSTDLEHTQSSCVMCGACVNICPTGAMQLLTENDHLILSLCGTTLCEDRLLCCSVCGQALGATRYIEYLAKKLEPFKLGPESLHLCPKCKQTSSIPNPHLDELVSGAGDLPIKKRIND